MEMAEFEAHLIAEGYEEVGSGCWSVVYGKDEVVCKVGKASSKGYLSFLREILAHQENPHLPKVYAAGIFHVARRPYFVVYMERLARTRTMNEYIISEWFEKHGLHSSLDFDDPDIVRHGKTKALKELAEVLAKLYQKHAADMADFNLMWRTVGQRQPELVIIDPVWR
jgi:hypothetical protein